MKAAETNIVAGTSPGKAGQMVDGVPVYDSIHDIKKDFDVAISIIFVPAPFAKAALLEAIREEVKLIVCITEGIPVHDMIEVLREAKKKGVTILGPNCPGALLPGVTKLGSIPAQLGKPGSVGIVSRSGTITYEVTAGISKKGLGQRYVIGIGGDRIHGIGFTDCLELFQDDPSVKQIVLIGEVGGTEELQAATYIQKNVTKPVFAYIAGHSAPKGAQLGHAGAILGMADESAQHKSIVLKEAGAQVFNSVTELTQAIE
jgi:succinyl-CoA synthetase alpha subunit